MDCILYVQILHEYKYSGLYKYNSLSTKNQFRDASSELMNVKLYTAFLIKDEMCYIFKDFHIHPHGFYNANKHKDVYLQLKHYPIQYVSINSIQNNILTYPVNVFYKDSTEVKKFNELHIHKEMFISILLKYGLKESVRDQPGNISRRMDFGFNQAQAGNSSSSRYINGVCLPFFKTRYYFKLNAVLIPEIGKILVLAQECIDAHNKNVMNDVERNKLFGHYMGGKFMVGNKSRFEYLDIFLHTSTQLQRHIDYQNGYDKYKYGCSYSFVSKYHGQYYRVNFIMCSRAVCHDSMNKLRNM